MKKNFIQKIFDRFVFRHTEKPEHYVHVDRPKTLQDHRQVQYNNWCKRYGVYNGSYLPENPDTLKKKGWKETTAPKNRSGTHRDFQRKSSGQMVRYDDKEFKRGHWEDEHYHWENAKSVKERRKLSDSEKYIDRYGRICADGAKESHLAPKDKKYNFRG